MMAIALQQRATVKESQGRQGLVCLVKYCTGLLQGNHTLSLMYRDPATPFPNGFEGQQAPSSSGW